MEHSLGAHNKTKKELNLKKIFASVLINFLSLLFFQECLFSI